MIQISPPPNPTSLTSIHLEQLCQPQQLERTLHLLFHMNHWAKARERLFFADRQGLYAVKATVLRQAYAIGAIEATAYLDGTQSFGRKLDPEGLSLVTFEYTSPIARYVFHLPSRVAETFLPAQQIHDLKHAPASSCESGEYYGRPITESESLQNPIRDILWELGVDIAAICPRQLDNKQEYVLAQIMRDTQWYEDWHYNDEDEELD